MLLAVDVGNTQTVLGLYREDELVDSFRLATDRSRTGDELAVTLSALLDLEDVDGVCLSTTVPALQREWERVAERWLKAPLLVVGPGTRTGIAIRYDDPREVGPDRIVNAVAASERYGAPCIVVDFGTSTNFDIVSPEGDYVGGVLAPGIEVSMDALFARAARLVKVDFVAPPTVIGKTTVRRSPVGPRLRLRGPGGRHRHPHPGRARHGRPDRRHGRARRADRAARRHARARRPVPDARRPPDRLGA
jgi:type III pantothenate kinase